MLIMQIFLATTEPQRSCNGRGQSDPTPETDKLTGTHTETNLTHRDYIHTYTDREKQTDTNEVKRTLEDS